MQDLFFKKAWRKIKKVGSKVGKVAKKVVGVAGKGLDIASKVNKQAMPFLPENYRKMAEKGQISLDQAKKYNDMFRGARLMNLDEESFEPMNMDEEMEELFWKKIKKAVSKVTKGVSKGLSIVDQVSKSAMPFLPDNYR